MIRTAGSQSPFLPTWVWLVPLSVAVLFYETTKPGPRDSTQEISWCAIAIIIGTAALTWICRIKKQFDLFEPLYMVFALFLIFYPVRALLAVWLDESWFDPGNVATWKSIWGSSLGFVCFAMGYKIARRKFDVPRGTWADRSWNMDRANVVSVAFLVTGIVGFVAMRILGGSFFYFVSLDSDIKSPESITPWFFYLLWICVFMQAGALVQLGIWFLTRRRTVWTMVYCILSLLSTFILSRYFTVLFLVMLAVCWHYEKRKISGTQLAAFFIVILAYLGLAGLYREWTSPGYTLEETAGFAELSGQHSKLVIRYVVRDLEQFSNLSEVISVTPSALPYQLGSTFTPVLLKPIPRTLMPTKPLGASAVFSRQVIPELYDSGLVTGVGGWGEWYLNFSWAGLVLGMALIGALSAAAYKAMQATSGFGGVLLYLSFIVVLFTWLRNDFNSAATFGLYYFIPSVVALAYVTKEVPGPRLAAPRESKGCIAGDE